ncbi:MAG: hypothetical protein ACYCQJ_13790 [Nitrososphaerales archaeon]
MVHRCTFSVTTFKDGDEDARHFRRVAIVFKDEMDKQLYEEDYYNGCRDKIQKLLDKYFPEEQIADDGDDIEETGSQPDHPEEVFLEDCPQYQSTFAVSIMGKDYERTVTLLFRNQVQKEEYEVDNYDGCREKIQAWLNKYFPGELINDNGVDIEESGYPADKDDVISFI